MNRRTAIKNTLLLGGAGLSAWSSIKLFKFFNTPGLHELPRYKEMISEMAEAIIPKTDTPGAKDAGVGDFIMLMIKDCTPLKVQRRFMAGLLRVEEHTRSRYGRTFAQCTPGERDETMDHFEREDKPFEGLPGKVFRRLLGDSFFVTLKRYTVIGYCTSMKGATEALAYDYIPGTYQGCLPLQPEQKSWAL